MHERRSGVSIRDLIKAGRARLSAVPISAHSELSARVKLVPFPTLIHRDELTPHMAFNLLVLLLHHFLVRGQGDEREVLAVEVVHQVEDAGEAGAGVPGFVPRTG